MAGMMGGARPGAGTTAGQGGLGSGSWGGGGGGGGGPRPHQGMKSKKQLEREREQQINSTRQNLFGSQGANLQQQAAAKAALARQEEDRRKQKAIDDFNKATAQKVLEQQAAEAELASRLKKDEAVMTGDAAIAEQIAAEDRFAQDMMTGDAQIAEQIAAEDRLANLFGQDTMTGDATIAEQIAAEDRLEKAASIREQYMQGDPAAFGQHRIINQVISDNPRIFGPDAKASDFTIKDGVMYTSDMTQRVGSVGKVGSLPGILGMGAGMLFGKNAPMFTADPMFAQEADREAGILGPGDRGQGNELGLSPSVYTQIQAEAQAAAAAEAEAAAAQHQIKRLHQPIPTEEILTGFPIQNNTAATGSGIASTPAAGNYMDYMQYAFRPVNTANPWAGSPTQNITGYNPLFANNPVYAADGGRINKMHGGMMIIEDNGVENNGIGAILKKYKEIRSEL